MWQAQIFTLYPEIFPGPLKKGLYGKALSKKITIKFLPKILFAKDESFDYAEKIEKLIKQANK